MRRASVRNDPRATRTRPADGFAVSPCAAPPADAAPYARARFAAVVALASCLLCASLMLTASGRDARRQQPGPVAPAAEDVTPPPVKRVPESERAQIAAAKDRKARLKLTIELSEARLTRAADFTSAEKFEDAADELGVYQALIEDLIKFLRQDGRAGKSRDLFKRLELTLRAHVPRIETLRRGLPAQNAVYAKATLDYIRGLRTEALNAFYDDTVLRDTPPPPPPKPETKPGGRGDDASQQSPAKSEKKP